MPPHSNRKLEVRNLKGIWVPLSGAIAQQRKVETIANNIANANTPGFKKDSLVFKEYLSRLNKGGEVVDLPRKEWRPEDFYRHEGGDKAMVKVAGSYTDFAQGQMSATGNPFDLAINGNGMFEVLTPNGVRYTRRGNLSVSQDGLLVTDQGFPVLSGISKAQLESQGRDSSASYNTDPASRAIQITGGKLSITNSGEIFQDGQPTGQLAVVEFNDINLLKKEGHSLYINNNNNNLKIEDIQSTVHQGFMEESNVNAIAEMSELIKANRHFESIQRAIKTYDQVSGRAVNDILKF